MDELRLEQRALLFDMLTNGTVDEATTRRLQQAIDTGNSAELFAIYNEHAGEYSQTQLKTSAAEGPQQGMSVSPDGDWKDALATSARNAGNNPNTTRVTGTQTTGTMPISNRSGTKGGAYQNIANTDLTIAHDADWSDITAQAAARRRENLDFLQRENGEVIGTQENVGEYESMFENIAKNADWMKVPDSPEYAARTAGAAFAIDPSEISDPSMRKQAQWGKGLSIAGGVGKFAMSGVKWGLDGYLEQKSQMDLLRERQKRQRKNLIGDGHEQVLAGGGEVYDAVELEKGEYVLHPDGFVEEEEGVKHTQGGNVRTDLEPGTKVVTDQTKVGKDFAKKINETFKDQGGSLNIKAKDTFAATIDKFKKKLGIQILEEEIKSITEAIKKQELVENKTTQNLNTMFLQSKLQEKVAEYEEAQETLSSYTEVIYQEQENRKKQQAEPEQTSFAKGGLVTTETIDAIATKNNISRDQVISILNSYQTDYGKGGKITVVDSGRSAFVKKATIQGMKPQDFATHVLKNKKDFSDDTIQQATFITNANGIPQLSEGGEVGAEQEEATDSIPFKKGQEKTYTKEFIQKNFPGFYEWLEKYKGFDDIYYAYKYLGTEDTYATHWLNYAHELFKDEKIQERLDSPEVKEVLKDLGDRTFEELPSHVREYVKSITNPDQKIKSYEEWNDGLYNNDKTVDKVFDNEVEKSVVFRNKNLKEALEVDESNITAYDTEDDKEVKENIRKRNEALREGKEPVYNDYRIANEYLIREESEKNLTFKEYVKKRHEEHKKDPDFKNREYTDSEKKVMEVAEIMFKNMTLSLGDISLAMEGKYYPSEIADSINLTVDELKSLKDLGIDFTQGMTLEQINSNKEAVVEVLGGEERAYRFQMMLYNMNRSDLTENYERVIAKYPTLDSLAYEDVDNFDIKDVNVTSTQVSQLQKLGINTFEELKEYTDESPENKEKAQDILGSRRLSQIINYHSDYELPEDSPEGTAKLEKLTDLGVAFKNIEDFQLTDEQVKGIQDLGIKDLKGIHTATPEQHEEIKKIIGNDTKHQAILDYSREVNANTEASAPINYTLDRIGGLAPEVTTTSGTLGGGSAGSNYEGPGAVETDEPIDTSRMEEQVSRAAQEAQKRLSMFDGNLPFSRPSLPVPETSQSVSYERLSIPEVSDAENIKNIERAQQFAEERLRGMPSSQSRALLANITAGTQEALNKSFSTTMAHNAQGQLQEQQYNASRADMEMEKNKALAMDYERRMFTSLDTYDNNSRAYHQARYEWERNKQRDQSTANLIDSLSEAYTFTEDGKIQMEQKDFMDLFNINMNGPLATQKPDKEKKNK